MIYLLGNTQNLQIPQQGLGYEDKINIFIANNEPTYYVNTFYLGLQH